MRPATRDAGFLDAAEREAARGAGLLGHAVRWCATAGFRIVVLEKSVFQIQIFCASFSALKLPAFFGNLRKPPGDKMRNWQSDARCGDLLTQ
jgi:hypothetical protein